MQMTNRAIQSREYKVLLNCERFRDRRAGETLFTALLAFLANKLGCSFVPNHSSLDLAGEKERTVWFLDTARHELQRANLILRVREEADAKKRFKITLKYRSADRYIAAAADLRCAEEVKKEDNKFEEDVTPPFMSKFSQSMSFKSSELPLLVTISNLIDRYPGLSQTELNPTSSLLKVNNFSAFERQVTLGKLTVPKPATANGLEDAEAVLDLILTYWYLRQDEEDYPLVVEFSFVCDAQRGEKDSAPENSGAESPNEESSKQENSDRLEQFSLHLLRTVNQLFEQLQNQAGWLAQSGSTKTAFVFDGA